MPIVLRDELIGLGIGLSAVGAINPARLTLRHLAGVPARAATTELSTPGTARAG